MTASESSFIGIGKQTAKGTPQTTDANFSYFLFTDGSVGPNNLFLPLDQEVGGGALQRSIVKAGVTSGGQFAFIPRPTVIGHFLTGALGEDNISGAGPSYTHDFNLVSTDQFSSPYYTIRSTPGSIWGEQFQDVRIAGLTLNWRAADYLRGTLGLLGGLPTPNVSTASWNPTTYLDAGPQFLAALSSIEIPTSTAVKVLSGSFTMGMNIPLDEQWIVGSYSPDDFDINSRVFVLTLGVKITSKALYEKANYDPAEAGAWLAEVYREADILIEFNSDQEADTGVPYSLTIAANGQTAASGDANVIWTATPVALRAGRQVTAVVTGTFVASDPTWEPVTVTLINKQSTSY